MDGNHRHGVRRRGHGKSRTKRTDSDDSRQSMISKHRISPSLPFESRMKSPWNAFPNRLSKIVARGTDRDRLSACGPYPTGMAVRAKFRKKDVFPSRKDINRVNGKRSERLTHFLHAFRQAAGVVSVL
jgi:hypothetical protein